MSRTILGFTGTREELTQRQKEVLADNLNTARLHGFEIFNHGDCVGADDFAADCAAEADFYIIAHPPTNDTHRAFNRHANLTRTPKPYLERNKAIVDASEVLIACPKGKEEFRSGTWSTVRYAIRKKKPVVIIWPTGMREER